MQVRTKMYDLLTHCIPATTILKVCTPNPRAGGHQLTGKLLTFRLIERCDDALKADVMRWAAFYEHRLHIGSKAIFHLEAFVAKFMRILEGYLMGVDW